MSLDVLAIAAHPDDVEQTCGGTLIRMAEAGYRTGVLDLTAGDMGTRGTPEQRVAESEVAGEAHAAGLARQPATCRTRAWKTTLAARMTLAVKIRELQAAGGDSALLAGAPSGSLPLRRNGLRGLLPGRTEEARRVLASRTGPQKILYASLYADVKPSFIVDISAQFERRMTALLSYASQYGEASEGAALFPDEAEIRERLGAIARFYGNQIGVKYGEPFVVKEAMRIDDIVAMPVRSI